MAKTDDYTTRAAEFLKQWQAQMTRQMHDPDMIRAMLTAMQSFGAKPHDETARKPATAPDAGDDAIRKLERRIDALERELRALHARLLPVDAKTKNPARAKRGSNERAVATAKRPVVGSKRAVAKKPKPATGKRK